MPDQPALDGVLRGDLHTYFAATTSTALPRSVTDMSVRTLVGRRRSRRALLSSALAVAAAVAAALVVVTTTHLGVRQTADNASLSAGSGTAPFEAPTALSRGQAPITYPGVDVAKLARGGVVLLAPGGHGAAIVGATQAQSTAATAVGAEAGRPGLAVLAFAELSTPSQHATCLCWVVDVPDLVMVGLPPGGTPPPHTELVLVDADTGTVVATLTGNGIP